MKETDILKLQKDWIRKYSYGLPSIFRRSRHFVNRLRRWGQIRRISGIQSSSCFYRSEAALRLCEYRQYCQNRKEIKKNTNVQEVRYQEDLINMVNENIRNISLMLLGLAVLLAFISFALINNTIRLTIYSKRFLIHTMKLVGASWSFIRRPFLWRNFWIGVLAAVIADGVLWAAAYWLVVYEPDLISVITPNVMLLVSVSVLVFGVCITWFVHTCPSISSCG